MGRLSREPQRGSTAGGRPGDTPSPPPPTGLAVAFQGTLAALGQGALSRYLRPIGPADHWRVLRGGGVVPPAPQERPDRGTVPLAQAALSRRRGHQPGCAEPRQAAALA